MKKIIVNISFLLCLHISCVKNNGSKSLENTQISPKYDKVLNYTINKLTSSENGMKYIIIFIYLNNKIPHVILQLSDYHNPRYAGLISSYSDDIFIIYEGFCDSIASEFIDMRHYKKMVDNNVDYSGYNVNPLPCHFFKLIENQLIEFDPTTEDLLYFDTLYFNRFSEHAYNKIEPPPLPISY